MWKVILLICLVQYSVCDDYTRQCGDVVCHNNGLCEVDDADTVYCDCRATGYRGKECLEDDPCIPNECYPGTCLEDTSIYGGYRCDCTGTGLMGTMCEEDDPCLPNPCENNGKCSYSENPESQYECACKGTGYIGVICEIDDPCHPSPCGRGVCVPDGDTGYMCECSGTGFKGTNCDIDDPCRPSPCENRGVCVDEGDMYSCTCRGTGYMGVNCEIDDPCLPSPCNLGKCHRLIDGDFTCECDDDYGGTYCDIKQPFKHDNGIYMNMKDKGDF